MTDLTIEMLRQLAPRGKQSILEGIVDNQYLLEVDDINPGIRRQMFLAQLAHESDGFKTTREYASGAGYEGRSDLGNVYEGDGRRYRGRGLIQLTGRANYREFSKNLDIDIEANPDVVETFPYALEVSTLFWSKRGLNEIADAGDFRRVTKRINGGYNGLADREHYFEIAKQLDL